MKAAKQIIQETCLVTDAAFTEPLIYKGTISVSEAIRMINQARKEAIQECADIAKVNMPTHPHLHGTKNVNMEEVLDLINHIK